MTHSYVWHDSCIYVQWLIMCVTWLIHISAITRHMRHRKKSCHTYQTVLICVIWLLPILWRMWRVVYRYVHVFDMCDMTSSYFNNSSQIGTSHVTHIKQSCSSVHLHHVTHMNESCHTHMNQAWRKSCHTMGWLWLVGSIKLQVSFAKEPYKIDDILQKRPIILSILLTVATP